MAGSGGPVVRGSQGPAGDDGNPPLGARAAGGRPADLAADLVLDLANRLDDLGAALARLDDWLASHQAASRLIYSVPLVLEELLTNTIKYGYEDAAVHRIRVVFRLGPPASLCIEDDGHPFDPVAAAPPAVLVGGAQQRPVGGLGLHMVRSIAAGLDYRRRDGINRIVIEFPD